MSDETMTWEEWTTFAEELDPKLALSSLRAAAVIKLVAIEAGYDYVIKKPQDIYGVYVFVISHEGQELGRIETSDQKSGPYFKATSPAGMGPRFTKFTQMVLQRMAQEIAADKKVIQGGNL